MNQDLNDVVQTATESGAPVDKRIPNVHVAFSIYTNFNDDFASTAFNLVKIANQMDGCAPKSDEKLKRDGASWTSNINSRSSEAMRDSNVTALWDMLTGVENLIEITPATVKLNKEIPYQTSEIIEQEFTLLMNEWIDFNYHVRNFLREMVQNAVGPVFFEDQYTWMFNTCSRLAFRCPANTKSSLGKLEVAMIRDEYTPSEFYAKFADVEVAESLGWNVAECKRLMVDLYKDGMRTADERYYENEWANIQQKIKNNDISLDDSFEGIKVVRSCCKELHGDQGITLQIFRADQEGEEFLFEQQNMFKEMKNAIQLMMFDTGDGYIRSIKSLGHRTYAMSYISDCLLNDAITGSKIASGILVQYGSEGQASKSSALYHGNGITAVPSHVEIKQSTFQPPIGELLNVRQSLRNILNQNVGIYDSNATGSTGLARSATEVQVQEQNKSRFENNQSSWYYSMWELLLKEVFNRVLCKDYPEWARGYKEHKLFVQRCVDNGVDKKWLVADKWTITARRSIGMGSPYMKTQIADKFLGMLPQLDLDEEGRRVIQRNWVNANGMPWNEVNKIKPLTATTNDDDEDIQEATYENNFMLMGAPVIVSLKDKHKIHLDVHLKGMVTALNQYEEASKQSGQQSDPSGLIQYLRAGLQHSVEHLQIFAINPSRKEEAKQYGVMLEQLAKAWQELMALLEKMKKQQQKQQEEQQKQQQEMQSKDYQFELDKYKISTQAKEMAEVKRYEADLLDQARKAKTQTSTSTSNQKTANSIATANLKTMTEIRNKTALVQAEINNKRSSGNDK